jgi:hypothetical protein
MGYNCRHMCQLLAYTLKPSEPWNVQSKTGSCPYTLGLMFYHQLVARTSLPNKSSSPSAPHSPPLAFTSTPQVDLLQALYQDLKSAVHAVGDTLVVAHDETGSRWGSMGGERGMGLTAQRKGMSCPTNDPHHSQTSEPCYMP